MTQAFRKNFPENAEVSQLLGGAVANGVKSVKETVNFQGLTEADRAAAEDDISSRQEKLNTHLSVVKSMHGTKGVEKEITRYNRISEYNPLSGFWASIFMAQALLNPSRPRSFAGAIVGISVVILFLSLVVSALSYSPEKGFQNPVDRIQGAREGFFYTE